MNKATTTLVVTCFLVLLQFVFCKPIAATPPNVVQASSPTTDWCTQISEADAALGRAPGTITVAGPGQSACNAAPRLGDYHSLIFNKPGIYQIATAWAIANKHDFSISCVPGTVISFTGRGGFTIDGSEMGNGARRIRIEGCIFSGNSYVTNAIVLNKVVESTFTDLTGMNATEVAILCKGCLANTFIRPASSKNNNLGPASHSVIPAVGLQLDTNGPIQSNVNNIIGPVFEGLKQGTGILCVSGLGNVISGGTSEGNAVGIGIAKNCLDTQVIGTDFEVNNRADISIDGPRSSFLNVTAYSVASALVEIGPNATETKLLGGTFHNIRIAPGANGTFLASVTYSGAGKGGAIVDNSKGTTKLSCRNLYTGAYDAAQLGGNGVQVGSASFSMLPPSPNGSLIFCSDCNSSCTAGGGTGRMCFRENGIWTR